MANNTIYIKKTAVAGRAPTTSNIGQGELAVNMTDQKLFSTNGSVVFEIGANLTSSMVGNSTANVTSNTTMLRIANSTASANLTPGSLTIGTSTVNSTVIQASTLAANGNVSLGTQTNKATVTYTTNTARTYTLPDAGANASFVMTEGTQIIPGAKTFSGGIGVREAAPSTSAAAVFTYTVGHSNATRYGLLNTLNIDNSTGDLTADRTAIGVSSLIESSIRNSVAFNHNIRAVYGVARTSTDGGNSIDGEGLIYAGDFSVLHQSNDPTYNKIHQARGVYGSVQTTGNTATINTAIGVYSTINPTNATSVIDTGYLFFGINGTGTGTYNKRWGVYISSPINNYFAGGAQIGGSATGSSSAAGLGVGVAPSGTSGTISMNGNLTGVANLVLGTQTNKATVTYSTNIARVYTMPDAGADASFVMSEGTQTINGAKSFTQNVSINSGSTGALTLNRSADNQFVGTTYATAGTTRWIQYLANNSTADMIFQSRDASGAVIGASLVLRNATRNADFVGNISIYGGAGGTYASTITSAPLAAFRTYTLPDAGADASFVMSEGTQTINGAKTFSNNVAMSANLAVDTNTLKVDSVNKRVGVRSTNPGSVFEVFSQANTAQWVVRAKTDSIFNSSGIWVDAFNNFTFDARDAAGNLNVSLNSSGVSFLKGGNVGIGNSNPTENLHVQGNIRVANAYVDATNSKGTAGQVLTSNSTHSYWAAVGAATNLVLTGSVTEDVDNTTYTAVTGTVALSAAAGTIQVWTLSGSVTSVTDSLSSGQYITLMIADGTAYTIAWGSTVTWVGGTAPTLATTGYTVIEIWKVGTVVYGAYIGAVA